jgi:hypothetical protein
MSIKYTNIFRFKTLQNLPKSIFWALKYTIRQPCNWVGNIDENIHRYFDRQFCSLNGRVIQQMDVYQSMYLTLMRSKLFPVRNFPLRYETSYLGVKHVAIKTTSMP